MSEFVIYIKVPQYEKEWCEHHFGNPVVFPDKSNLNSVIRHFLRIRPQDYIPQRKQDDEMAVRIPKSQSKRPETYNYLTRAGRQAISEAVNDLFTISLWEGLTDVGCRGVKLSNLILDWMSANGIGQDNYDNLRQKFTRIKDSYRKKGVNVSRGYKHEHKKC